MEAKGVDEASKWLREGEQRAEIRSHSFTIDLSSCQ